MKSLFTEQYSINYEAADFINEKPENECQVLRKMSKVEC